ncbi:MAG: exonuclease SbcCD subunit D [Pseudomonadota bacterium]
MRFIHTADWHLGRLMHGVHLTDDQAHVLDQLVDLIDETKPDALLISGDIYDRAVPPPEAVALLDDFLSRVVRGLGRPVLLIAGNHDSARRLEFGSKMLAEQGLHVFGSVTRDISPVLLSDHAGPVRFYAVPFAEPALVRAEFSCESVHDHDSAWRAVREAMLAGQTSGSRAVIVAHAFVTGAVESESERPLSVGGADMVDSSCFADFDYAALGHLHRPQSVGVDHVRYAGSLLKYSFSEVDHHKSVTLVEMDARGKCRTEGVSLTPRRDVRCVSGHLRELLEGPKSGESRHDYLSVTLLDTGPILDAMGRLREVYPNALHVERIGFGPGTHHAHEAMDHRTLDDADLFAAFFSQVTGDELTDAEAQVYAEVADDMRRREREAVQS